MYKIKKRLEISASHSLKLNYDSACENLHGHNWIITIFCKSKILNKNGMVIDFMEIKNKIHTKLDHKDLNKILDFNPTAENISKWCVDQIKSCYKCEVIESNNNKAIYEI
jgi:6-pyruvoyltetrahydropterin/6-carboxytetrahydropterin synthase